MTLPATPVTAVTTLDQARHCFPAIHELRPHLDEATFLARWHTQVSAGYELVFVDEDDDVAAVAGFRELHTLAWGHIIYLDDLVAASHARGKGYGSLLLGWLQQQTVARGCEQLHLDTGYTRHDGHRAYLRNGFEMVAHHMSWVPR